MSEDTRLKLSLPELVEPPMKPYLNPFPPKGKVYDYRFVKEVKKNFEHCTFEDVEHLHYMD